MNRLQDSFSDIMRGVEAGDEVAEERLWNEFYQKLLNHVEGRVKLRGVPNGLLDPEAVTVSVLESIFKCAKQGRLQNVQDWSELSRLLLAMTNRKFVDHWRRATAQRASPGMPLKSLTEAGLNLTAEKLDSCSVSFEEQLSRLMGLLPDDVHRQIAVLKLAEYTVNEISERVGRAIPTVTRKWKYIRRVWADELEK